MINDDATEPIEELVSKLGVQNQVSGVLFAIFPGNEFVQHLTLFTDAVSRPISLKPFITALRKQLNAGACSHTAFAMCRFLDMDSSFEIFTRDYIRRCCDMVEFMTKCYAGHRLGLESEAKKKPLGSVINLYRKKASGRFPDILLDNLTNFNTAIYCRAKHDSVSEENERMFSIADAVAVTFIAVRLCQQLDRFQITYPFGDYISNRPEKTDHNK